MNYIHCGQNLLLIYLLSQYAIIIHSCSYLHQLTVHKQRQRDLSGLSKGLEGRKEVAQNLHCWQNLLTAHSLELAELINNLDEEATADIRKVPP